MLKTLTLLIVVFLFTKCYYDNLDALHGNPVSTCDTTNVTYSGSVFPIIQTWCLGCHSSRLVSEGAGGGHNLEDFSTVKSLALNGHLLGAVEHLPGYSPMPKFGNKLSDCDIAKFRIWVTQGVPNN